MVILRSWKRVAREEKIAQLGWDGNGLTGLEMSEGRKGSVEEISHVL